MKTRKFISVLAFLALSFTSCSGSDEETSVSKAQASGPQNSSNPTNPLAGKFTKNVLIEDFTGTWCGFCPRVSYAIEKVHEQNINAIPVAIHRSSGTSDPYHFQGATVLISQIPNFGYPTGLLNRKEEWTFPEPTNINQVKNYTGFDADLGIAMKSVVQNGNIKLDVKVKFDANMSNLKLVVYILEDDLKYNQTNYTSYYGGVSVIQNFEHDHVLRAALTNILGDNITGNTNDGNVYTRSFSQAVPANISDPSKISFVAFVLDSSGRAVNSRSAVPNDNQNFQENQ